jgi:molybdate transport system ATP-binding protein
MIEERSSRSGATGMIDAAIALRRGAFELDVALASSGVTVIMGANGSGKTTLLRAIVGVITPERGRVAIDGRVLFDRDAAIDVPVEERELAYVPQGYGLFPHLTALDNVLFGVRRGPDRRARAMRLLDELELSAAMHRRPASLSGGEQQRVALARALATEPRALLLDEPLAALDASARPKTRRLLAEWLAKASLPALVVTHDPEDARALADAVVILEAGRVAQAGLPAAIAADPTTPVAAALAHALLRRET